MKTFIAVMIVHLTLGCIAELAAQDRRGYTVAGGRCEGCEGLFEYGDKILSPVDTLPDFRQAGPKIMLTGTIYERDGKTPASGVILYVYHTDQDGLYSALDGDTGWGKRHGHIRGWIRTDSTGRYAFYTLKPGSYPNGTAAAHVHPTILEPGGRLYWVETYFFEGDPLLTERELTRKNVRGGGTGIVKLVKEGDLSVARRDIVLGKNVPE